MNHAVGTGQQYPFPRMPTRDRTQRNREANSFDAIASLCCSGVVINAWIEPDRARTSFQRCGAAEYPCPKRSTGSSSNDPPVDIQMKGELP